LRFVPVMSGWLLRLSLGALLVSVPAIAADRAGAGSQAAVDSPAPATDTSGLPVAGTTDAHTGYPYRPYCDPHSDSYVARNCHASCAAWWCDLYWNQRP